MKLRKYIKSNNLTLESFSFKSGCSYTTLLKWVYGSRIPSKNYMQIIYKKTNGEVAPNDFYDLNEEEK